jgi:hypothetical protein
VGEYLQPDSSYLNITYAVMFDRTGRQYGAEIAPDVPVTGPAVNTLRPQPAASDPVVAAATQWLRSRPECGGTGAVTRGPAFGRTPTTADLPGTIAPAARPLPPVSRWFVQPRG